MFNLYIVATPIGNLGDITLRALEVLKRVDFIICEDTRQTQKLLSHYKIEKPKISYHLHSKIQKTDQILGELIKGREAALVSDAGTPGISDPGGRLIQEIRDKLTDKIRIMAIPGSSALTAAASISGLPCDKFTFLGFLPHKKGRETLFKKIAENKETVIFYESPYRILKTLESLSKVLDKKRKVVVARELTKIYEEVVHGDILKVKSYFAKNHEKVKGEFVVIISR